LLASGAKSTDQALLINALAATPVGRCRHRPNVGGPLSFATGIGDVLADLLKERSFAFAVERAVFVGTRGSAAAISLVRVSADACAAASPLLPLAASSACDRAASYA
jgi:hypothetical protein